MCLAPQRRALFRHDNFQEWSENGVLCTFWLGHVLRATTACTFSTFQLQKVLRMWDVFSFFTSKRASRHNGVQFFISHLARWPRTRRFSEVTFRPSGATNHCKNTVNRDFPTFSRTCIFFRLTFSPLWSSHFFSSPLWLFPPLLFQLSTLSEVSLQNFLRWIYQNHNMLRTHLENRWEWMGIEYLRNVNLMWIPWHLTDGALSEIVLHQHQFLLFRWRRCMEAFTAFVGYLQPKVSALSWQTSTRIKQ